MVAAARFFLVLSSAALLVGCQAMLPEQAAGTNDPFDYNYCGGVPVYPVIGIGFSTLCGPRNQIGVGRYGTLMWLFPAPDGKSALYQGTRKLSIKDLKYISLLAEVVDLADAPTLQSGAVNYRLGINFSGRATKRIHAVKDGRDTPANQLFETLLAMVHDKPALPDCRPEQSLPEQSLFDPYELPADRHPITLEEAITYQEQHRVDE
jgi:hypothetical protein